MDPERYPVQQGWDNDSALEGYGAGHEPDFRSGGSYGDRRYMDEGFSREQGFGRDGFHRDTNDRDMYPPPITGVWNQSRRRDMEGEYAMPREPRRHEKSYGDSVLEMDDFHVTDRYRGADSVDKIHDKYHNTENYNDANGYRDYGFDRHARPSGRERDNLGSDNYEFRHRISEGREDSRDWDYDFGRYSYDSDHDRRDGSWRRRESRDCERDKRGISNERDRSPYRRRYDRSVSRGHDDRSRSRSRSPRGRSRGRSYREDSFDDSRYEKADRRRERDREWQAPSSTVVVRGLSPKTTESELHQLLANWGPLYNVRVIRERSSGVSRGYAFIDFPSVEAARSLMNGVGLDGLVIDERKIYFEYSKPTSWNTADSGSKSASYSRSSYLPSDWMCTMCGCVNFARRTSCFQCNEPRTDDAPPADVATSCTALGPTHVLVVRGLDENADEEVLRYEFAKHAPIKDIRLVRNKLTHVSKGFAFVHFHSVEDATKVLEATNGITLEKNGQILRVAYAKSIHGAATGAPQSSSLAAAAIEAATFSQQYDAVGWAPKEYNPDEKQSINWSEKSGIANQQMGGSAPQSGFVWDEKSGYYYDAASGFYYDGNTGLYYDGNTGTWYSYDNQNQQYIPCTEQPYSKASGEMADEVSKSSDTSTASNNKKVIISAPATTTKPNEKASLADAVQAAAAAALAAEKKEKEKAKEIKLASKSSLLANKKKMNNVLAMWKQRNHEGQAARVVLDDGNLPNSMDENQHNTYNQAKSKSKADSSMAWNSPNNSMFPTTPGRTASSSFLKDQATPADNQSAPKPVGNSSGGTIMGVIRSSGKGLIKSDSMYSVSSANPSPNVVANIREVSHNNLERPASVMPFRTEASALGSYASPAASGGGRRRFSEMPTQSGGVQTTYRDRAAERRNLYGSSSAVGESDIGLADANVHPYRRGSSSDVGEMPFPPGVGGRPAGDATASSSTFEVITADRALDESNVGNRMLRNMGWQDGSGLGKDGSGIKEPVQAKAVDDRSGLGSQHRKPTDPNLETNAGDSYRTIIQKKAIARFREMS